MEAAQVDSTKKLSESETCRPLAKFSPDIWEDYFISMPSDESKFKSNDKQVEVLKEEVKKMLETFTSDPVEKIVLINSLCRLGVSYHFEDEINQQLNQNFHDQLQEKLENNDLDLYTSALVFRVLRQQGYKMSCDIFNKFKDNDGGFKESITGDTKGLLSLYEAAHLGLPGEAILNEALAFSKAQLESILAALEPSTHLARHVRNALNQPLHRGMARLEAGKFIDFYESDEFHNETLLSLAKLDYNRLQFIYQQELRAVSKWWKDTNIPTQLSYARHRLVECYFWTIIMQFEPRYTLTRIIQCKILQLETVLNDTYDAYGTTEEHLRFTEAMERWDNAALDELPPYMRVFYKAFLDVFRESDNEFATKGRSYSIDYAKEGIKLLVRSYQRRSKWFKDGYEPSFDMYIYKDNISIELITTVALSFMEIAGVKEYEWLLNNPRIGRAAGLIFRLKDDIAGHEDEQKRPHVLSSVECYMKQFGVPQDKAVDELQKIIENSWKIVNEECMRKPTDVPKEILATLANFARLADVTYKDNVDRYTNPEHLKHCITQLFIDPIPI